MNTDTAFEIWRAAKFAHHARDMEGKIRLLDAWHDECEAELKRLLRSWYDCHPNHRGWE